jgi:predicted HTH domain antitoxin
LSLFEAGLTTLAQAARIAGLSLEELVGLLGELGINAVDYPTQELDEELEAAL